MKHLKFDFATSLNQPPILENYNLFMSGAALQTAVEADGGAWNTLKSSDF